jgi:hypothetical protein
MSQMDLAPRHVIAGSRSGVNITRCGLWGDSLNAIFPLMKVLIGRLEKWKKSKVDVVAQLWHHSAQISIEGPIQFLDHEQVTIKGVNGSMTVRLTNARRFDFVTGSGSQDLGEFEMQPLQFQLDDGGSCSIIARVHKN